MSASKKTSAFRPGQTAPRSGQYDVEGPRGGDTGLEVTIVKGKPFPPTPKPGQTYVIADPTKNGAGRGQVTMFRIDGLEKFTAQIKRLETNARALEGKHSVKVTDLFTPDFMRRHTPFGSLSELEQACPLPILTSDEWEAPPGSRSICL